MAMIRIMPLFRVGLLATTTLALAGQVHATEPSREDLQDLLNAGQVSRVAILRVPRHLLTIVRIDSASLRKLSRYEFVLRDPKSSGHLKPLIVALDELSLAKPAKESDLRWGILFIDNAGKERGAIFLDRTGRRGEVHGAPVALQGKLFDWIQTTFRNALK